MNLFEQLQKQRYEALKVFGNEMWGVVVHAQTYRELVAECLDGRAVSRIGDVCATPNGDYIFGLRIIPSLGVAPNTFVIVDKRLGENILGTEAWYEADRKTESNSEKLNNYEPKICDFCRYYNSGIPCGSTPSACKKADKFAKEFVDGLKKLKPKDEPQTEEPSFTATDFGKGTITRYTDELQTDVYDYKGNGKWEQPDCPWK